MPLEKLFEELVEHLNMDRTWEILDKLGEFSEPGGQYRLAGTKAEEKTVYYIADKMMEIGLEIDIQEVPVDKWVRRGGRLRFEDGYEVELYPYPGVDSTYVEGVFTTEVEGDLKGKIVYTEDLLRWPSHVIPLEEYSVRGAAAAVIVKPGLPDNLYYIADSEGGASIPFATVMADAKEELLKRSGLGCSFELDVEVGEGVGYNVIGSKGEGYEVVLSAHHDAYAPGAVDNAVGVAMILDIAEKLIDILPSNRRLLVISFTAEEYGRRNTLYDYLIGSTHFFRERDNSSTLFMYNIDVAALKDEPHGLIYTADLNQLVAAVLPRLYNSLSKGVKLSSRPSLWLDMWPAVASGVSAISLSQLGWNKYHRLYYHTEGDTKELVDEEMYREAYALSTVLVHQGLRMKTPAKISDALMELRRGWSRSFLKSVGREYLYQRLVDVERLLRWLELARDAGVESIPGLPRIYGVFRRRLYPLLYSYGASFPTTLFAENRGRLYRELLELLKDIAYLKGKGETDIASRIEVVGIAEWGLKVSRETVDRVVERFSQRVYWGEEYLPPYPRIDLVVKGELDVGKAIEELVEILGKELDSLESLLIDLEDVIKGYGEDSMQ